MKLSDIRQLVAENSIQLTKSLGQNFLHDANQLRRIIAAADLKRSDKVLEIGPGLGPLTELLLAAAGEVMAIEKDARLIEVLNKRLITSESEESKRGSITRLRQTSAWQARTMGTQLGNASLTLIHDDALDFLRRELRDWNAWKVVSNLPYSVASPIIVELAQSEHGPERIVVTLQLEVARRLMAVAGDADYGLLSLLVQLSYEPKQFFKIPASCFFPEPEVDSACVCLMRRPRPLLAPGQRPLFVKIVKRSFSQRRKMMMKLLKEDWPAEQLARVFEQLQLPPQTRAEMVGVEQFVRLTQALSGGG